MGGDEFAIVSRADEVSAVRSANTLLGALAKPYTLADQELHVSANVGISLYPTDGGDVVTLLRQADSALRDAKAQAAEVIAQAERRAAQIVEEAKTAAKEEGNRQLAAAQANIEQEANRARESLREQVAALAVAGAEKILRREVNAQTHADLLGQLKAEL